MSLKQLSNPELHESALNVAREERRNTKLLLEHLGEVESRRLYLDYGYETMWAYVTRYLKYESASAQRRIDAARVLRVVPEAAKLLEQGTLTVSSLALVEQISREERRDSGKALSQEQKQAWVKRFEGKSFKQAVQEIRT